MWETQIKPIPIYGQGLVICIIGRLDKRTAYDDQKYEQYQDDACACKDTSAAAATNST